MGSLETIIAAAGAVFGSVLTILLTKGAVFYLNYRKQAHSECVYEDEQAIKGYDYVISQLKETNKKIDDRFLSLQIEHVECVKNHAVLVTQNTMLSKEMNRLADDNVMLRSSVERLQAELNELRAKVINQSK